MREKNIKRAAHCLYLSQGDDKNKLLARRITDKKARKVVEDQGRALVVLEKLVLPYKKEDYDEDEMFKLLMKKLKKKGHRIQDDESEDDEQYAKEKAEATEKRLARVPTFLGMSLSELDEEEAQEKAVDSQESDTPAEEAPSLVLPPKRTYPSLLDISLLTLGTAAGIMIGTKLADRSLRNSDG